MKYTHEDEKLNSLLGKRVKVLFFDDEIKVGILGKAKYFPDYYEVENCAFRKSHVKKVVGLYGYSG